MNSQRIRPIGDIALALVLILLSGAIFIASFDLPEPALEPIGPAAFPFAASSLVIGFSLLVLWQAFFKGAVAKAPPDYPQRKGLAWLMIAMTIAYFLVMQMGWLNFRWATVAYAFLLTAALFDWQPRRLPAAAVIGLIMGIGLKFVFTDFLYLDLP